MAVITLKKEAQTVSLGHRASPQIFIAHSVISDKLMRDIKTTLKQAKVNSLFADRMGKQQFFNIIEAMFQSDALFVILTKKAVQRKTIRDWILFELGLANGIWNPWGVKKSLQTPIFLWQDSTLRLSNKHPLGMITKVKLIQMNSKKSRETMLRDMQIIAQNLSMKSY